VGKWIETAGGEVQQQLALLCLAIQMRWPAGPIKTKSQQAVWASRISLVRMQPRPFFPNLSPKRLKGQGKLGPNPGPTPAFLILNCLAASSFSFYSFQPRHLAACTEGCTAPLYIHSSCYGAAIKARTDCLLCSASYFATSPFIF